MKSEENQDIFNTAADTIIKWYQETHSTMNIVVHPKRNSDIELMRILLAAKKQTLGALTLLANSHILPTHALIRVLAEIWVVLIWALKPSKGEEGANSDGVYKKLKQWDITRLREDIALLKELSPSPEIKSAIKKAEEAKEKLEKIGIEKLPKYQQLFRKLGDNPKEQKMFEEVYARIYRKYSRAVHLNRNTTENFIQIKNENASPTSIIYHDDIKSDGEELMNIICISSDINKAIRNFYGWGIKTIQSECKHLIEIIAEDTKVI